MRSLLLLICCLAGLQAISQESFIVDKKGNQITVRDEQVEIILIDKRISYKEMGKTWEKYIRFKDLDYAVIGNSMLKSFSLNKKKSDNAFFVLAESSDKYLVGTAVTVMMKNSSTTHYHLLVLDSESMILEEAKWTDRRGEDEVVRAAAFIEKHFPKCEDILIRLSESGRNVSNMLSSPLYLNCN